MASLERRHRPVYACLPGASATRRDVALYCESFILFFACMDGQIHNVSCSISMIAQSAARDALCLQLASSGNLTADRRKQGVLAMRPVTYAAAGRCVCVGAQNDETRLTSIHARRIARTMQK